MADSPKSEHLRLHRAADDASAPAATHAAGGPRIDMQDIFRQLIVDEIKNGRLTPWRRRRIVRYAAQLRLTAVQAGRLIEQCRKEMELGDDPAGREFALRLVQPPRPIVPTHVKMWVVIALAVILDILLVGWLL